LVYESSAVVDAYATVDIKEIFESIFNSIIILTD
jgi:hypothetical protein